MGVKVCLDSCMGEISLHVTFLLFHLALYIVKFNPLPLDICKVGILCLQGVDIGNNSSIAKVKQRVVYDKVIV
jgi:hypothetical protein